MYRRNLTKIGGDVVAITQLLYGALALPNFLAEEVILRFVAKPVASVQQVGRIPHAPRDQTQFHEQC